MCLAFVSSGGSGWSGGPWNPPWAGGWLLWRQRRSTVTGRELRSLAIDETRSLGNRQFLVVASYEGRKFLLGVCPGRIDMLTPLDGSAPREKARE